MPKVIEATIGKGHYKTIVSNGRLQLPADEPVISGGTEEGFSPTELLYSALATCTCITLRMYADRKQWPLDSIKVTLSQERSSDETGGIVLEQDIELTGLLTTEQRYRLLDISKHCPVHQLLAQPIHVTNHLL
ncbi:MAG: OsmC family protein [Chitinophagaceae bacterium]|nr:OsmC family protein [Chitinophagaceae bacterium]